MASLIQCVIVIECLGAAGTHRTCPVRHTSLWNGFKPCGLCRLKRAQMGKIHVQALMRIMLGRRSTCAPVGLFESGARSLRPSPSRPPPSVRIGGRPERPSRLARRDAPHRYPGLRAAQHREPAAAQRERARWPVPDRYVLGCAVFAVGEPAGADPGGPVRRFLRFRPPMRVSGPVAACPGRPAAGGRRARSPARRGAGRPRGPDRNRAGSRGRR